MVKCWDPSLIAELEEALLFGKTVLIFIDDTGSAAAAAAEYTEDERTFLTRLLRREFKSSDEEEEGIVLSLSDETNIQVNPRLRMFMVIRKTVESVMESDGTIRLSSFLSNLGIHSILDSSVVDIELKKKALENNLQKFIVAHEHPEYQISYKSLLTDLSLHEQKLEASQDRLLVYTLDPKNESLLLCKDLLSTISDSEASEIAAHEQIREAKKNLSVSDQQVLPYRPFSHYASVVLSSIQKVSSTVHYFNLSVDEFKEMLSEVINAFKNVKVADHAMSLKAHVIHLKNQLMLSVYQKLQVCV